MATCFRQLIVYDLLKLNQIFKLQNVLFSSRKSHVYYNMYPWNNKNEFVEKLMQGIVHNEGGLVAIDKPYGVGIREPDVSSKKSYSLNTGTVGDSKYYISDALPLLSKNLGLGPLSLIKAPERYTSGVMLLSSNDKITNRIKKSYNKAISNEELNDIYWTITISTPVPQYGEGKYAITLKSCLNSSDKQVILENKWTNKSRKRCELYVTKVKHKTLINAALASLVEILPSRKRYHFVRVYMASVLSPILGDNLYGSRVQNILGKPVVISPYSDKAKEYKRLNKDMLAALKLQTGEDIIIPTHTHLKQRILTDYYGKNNDLIIEAPLPQHFQWTCEQLNLQIVPSELTTAVQL